MGRPSRILEQREQLLPVVARTFNEMGYHRATTAEIARRCRVRENILYRHWRDKKAMFLASIQYVYDLAIRTWMTIGAGEGRAWSPTRILDYEAEHIGEFGNYRILFSALGEPDDPEIRMALCRVYRNFHAFLQQGVRAHRKKGGRKHPVDADLAAWALIGLGTVSTIVRELRLVPSKSRGRLLARSGRLLLKGG